MKEAGNCKDIPLVKFCGISRYEDIAPINEIMPDYIGFVFAIKSKRYISPEKARELRFGKCAAQPLSAGIKAVGVFVNEPPENVARIMNDGIIDMAQLHGSEDEIYIRKLRGFTNKPIIKAFDALRPDFVKEAALCSADFILIDSCAEGRGGSGRAFDWCKVRELERPFFLAGGLNADNVAEAANVCAPYAVDVSSGIETEGVKDPVKMRSFMDAVMKIRQKLKNTASAG